MKRGLLALLLVAVQLRAEVPAPGAEGILRSAFEAEIADQRARALDLFRQYLDKGPESAFLRAQEARLLSQEGKPAEALLAARRALAIAPHRKEYHLLVAELLRLGDKKSDAAQVLTEATLRFPDDGELEFHLAETLGDLSRSAEALVHYRQALFYNGSAGSRAPVYRSVSLLRLAVLRLQASDPLRARPYMERYLQLNPDRLWSRNVLASDIYLSLGQFEEASRELGYVIGADSGRAIEAGIDQKKARMVKGTIDCFLQRPGCSLLKEFPDSILARGLLQSHAREHGPALRTLLPFIRENQQNLFARMAAYRALRSAGTETIEDLLALSALCEQYGRHRDALELLESARLLVRKEDRPEEQRQFRERRLHRHMARVFGKLGQTHRALVEYREAWKDAGQEDIDLRLEFARLLSTDEGRSEEALKMLGEPESLPGRLLRASILETLDRCEEALKVLDAAGPEGEQAAPYLRASCFERMGMRKEASAAARVLFEARKNDPIAMNFLAYMLALEGRDLEEAKALSLRTLAADPESVAYQDTYGWILFQQKDFTRARYHLQFASRLSEEEGQANAEVYFHVGEVYLALGEKNKALYYLDSARRKLAEKSKQGRMEESLYKSILARLKGLES